MKRFFGLAITVVVSAAAVLCLYLTRLEWECVRPSEHGECRCRFAFRK